MLPFEQGLFPSTGSAHCRGSLTRCLSVSERSGGPAPVVLRSRRAMNTTPQRENWNGHPVELGDAWTLRKGTNVARCVLVRHQLGWELRLMVGELLRSQVCRLSEEIWSTQESWKAAMMTKGWHV